MSDKPTIRDMTSDGASVRRIVAHIRERMRPAGSCSVDIGFSTTYGWVASIELISGTLLRTGCGHVHLMDPIDTLVRLLDEIDMLIDKYWKEHAPDA